MNKPFSIELRGVKLSQAQLDAIVPVLNEKMRSRKMSLKAFEERCIQAMVEAGHPLTVKESK